MTDIRDITYSSGTLTIVYRDNTRETMHNVPRHIADEMIRAEFPSAYLRAIRSMFKAVANG